MLLILYKKKNRKTTTVRKMRTVTTADTNYSYWRFLSYIMELGGELNG